MTTEMTEKDFETPEMTQLKNLLTSNGIEFRDGGDFSANQAGSIWTWAEGEHDDYFDYYTSSPDFAGGVNISFNRQLESIGFYVEWYDCATIFIYPIFIYPTTTNQT